MSKLFETMSKSKNKTQRNLSIIEILILVAIGIFSFLISIYGLVAGLIVIFGLLQISKLTGHVLRNEIKKIEDEKNG